MLKKAGAILLYPATMSGAVIGLVCYLLTGKHPSTRFLMASGALVVAAVAIAIGVALGNLYGWYSWQNSPEGQCVRALEEGRDDVCTITLANPLGLTRP
ncbi:MAG TPA: hypothetical protein VGO52_07155 [Hyphomonadaceae bacterium]|jgi:hypothetical protein|nr:hypothetical protein [Hyphomonadaceae bacterium]